MDRVMAKDDMMFGHDVMLVVGMVMAVVALDFTHYIPLSA
jgi:hypothetical protein